MPISLDQLKDGKRGLEDDNLLESIDKIRDYVTVENKKLKDELTRMNLSFE